MKHIYSYKIFEGVNDIDMKNLNYYNCAEKFFINYLWQHGLDVNDKIINFSFEITKIRIHLHKNLTNQLYNVFTKISEILQTETPKIESFKYFSKYNHGKHYADFELNEDIIYNMQKYLIEENFDNFIKLSNSYPSFNILEKIKENFPHFFEGDKLGLF